MTTPQISTPQTPAEISSAIRDRIRAVSLVRSLQRGEGAAWTRDVDNAFASDGTLEPSLFAVSSLACHLVEAVAELAHTDPETVLSSVTIALEQQIPSDSG